MTFHRTLQGLSNICLFLKVDAVVFVEGGRQSFSLAQVLSGAYGVQSIDVLFWRGVFNALSPAKRLAFLPVGPKSTLLPIAVGVQSGLVSNVYVAMDRDHDHVTQDLITAPGVLYTFGYSWENDAWSANVIEACFRKLCPISLSVLSIRSEIDSCIGAFTRDIRWAVYADMILALQQKSILPRTDFAKALSTDANGAPCVDRFFLKAKIQQARQTRANKLFLGVATKFNVLNDCYGHFFATFCYRLLEYLLKKHASVPQLPTHFADALAIDEFSKALQLGAPQAACSHHLSQCTALP